MRRDMRGDLMERRIRKIIKTKYFKIILLLGICFCFASWNGGVFDTKLPPVNMTYVVVHLDFKRTPLKLDYLQTLLKTLKDHGANGLLMEYEDMFPFTGNLVNLSARNCYGETELKQFLQKAQQLGFEIIPLVQTFGHMQYVLKLEEFKYLRENTLQMDSICPSQPESKALIKDMLEQVIKFHTSVVPLKNIHIGCDEVYHIGTCEVCAQRNQSTQRIYLKHVTYVYNVVKRLSKYTAVLLWDDMLRPLAWSKWRFHFHPRVEVVYWRYDPYFNLQHYSLRNYHKAFPNIWIASAFKGADGPSSILPDIPNRYLNHYTWLNKIKNYKFGGETHYYTFKGIILTGWARYDHNRPSCDLLPGSIPSLMLNLLLVQEFRLGRINRDDNLDPVTLFNKNIETKLRDSLKCQSLEVGFGDNQTEGNVDRLNIDACKFEGSKLYGSLKACINLNTTIINSVNATKPKMFSNVDWCTFMTNSIKYLENDLTENMRQYYEENFITEYVFQKIFSLKMGLKYCYK